MWGYFRILLHLGILAAIATNARAECGPRPINLCQLINDDREIFVGRVLSSVTHSSLWRMRVVRSYRGSARGEVLVTVWEHGDLPVPAGLGIGESYLFYVAKTVEGRRVKRTTDIVCGDWLPLSAVSREELDFLDGLSRPANGRIFGTLAENYDPAYRRHHPLAGIKVLLTAGTKTYSGTTDPRGYFEIRGLPPGRYRVSTTAPPDKWAVGMDPERIAIVPHGCFEAHLIALRR